MNASISQLKLIYLKPCYVRKWFMCKVQYACFQNAFWFSVGWVVAFFLPSLIVALVLNSEYRKIGGYDDTDNKSFDDP